MFEGDNRKALQSLTYNGNITEKSMKTPWHALDAIGMTIKSEEHFWAFQDKLMLGNSQVRVYMCCPPTSVTSSPSAHSPIPKCRKYSKLWSPTSVTSSPSAHSPIPKCRKYSKSWSYNMQCNIMRPETGSTNRTSPSSPTSLFPPSVSSLNPDVSNTKKPRRGDELTSHPQPQ